MTAERPNSLGEQGPATVGGRSVRLAWTDPVTRDRIVVDLLGSEGFLLELLDLGFELAPDAGAEAPAPDGAGRRAHASERSSRPRAGGRAGDAA